VKFFSARLTIITSSTSLYDQFRLLCIIIPIFMLFYVHKFYVLTRCQTHNMFILFVEFILFKIVFNIIQNAIQFIYILDECLIGIILSYNNFHLFTYSVIPKPKSLGVWGFFFYFYYHNATAKLYLLCKK
jgi:hypothetical protein